MCPWHRNRRPPARAISSRPSARRSSARSRRPTSSDPIVEPLWVGVRALAAIDEAGAILVDEAGVTIEGFDEIVGVAGRGARASGLVLDGFLTKQATQTAIAVHVVVGRDAVDGARSSGSRRNRAVDTAEAARGRARGALVHHRRRRSATSPPTCSGSTTRRSSTSRCSSGGASSRASSIESDVVRIGAFVRPPIQSWVGSWRAQGFRGPDLQGRQQPLPPGRGEPGLGRQRDAAPLTHARWYGWRCAPNRADAGHPRRDRAARPGRHHGRHPELQERGDDRLRRPRRPGRPRPVLPGPPARSWSTPTPGRPTGPAASWSRPSRPTTSSRSSWSGPTNRLAAGQPDLPGDRRGRRQGRRAADHLRDRRRARGPGARRRRLGPALDRPRVDRAARRADPQGRLRLRRSAVRPLQVRRHDHQHRHLPADPGALRPPHPPADRRRLRRLGRPRPALPRARRLDRRTSAASASTSG